MELRLRPDAKNVVVRPQGPGCALLTVKARVINPDNEGVLFWFKNKNGELIAQKQLLPVNPNDFPELRFILEADVVNKLVESRSQLFLVNFAGNNEDLSLDVLGRLSMGQVRPKSSLDENPPRAEPKSEPKKEEVKPAPPKTEPTPPPTSPKAEPAKKSVPTALIAAIAGGVVLLALIAAALWYFLFRADEVTAPQNPPQASTTQDNTAQATENNSSADDQAKQDDAVAASGLSTAKAATGGISYGSCDLNSTSDDKALISNCMASKPDNEVLLKLGNDALKSGRCDIASRVFSSLGRSGAQGAALTYARYFDPASDLSSGCVKKDAAQAKYWYEKARDNGSESDVKAATTALESLK